MGMRRSVQEIIEQADKLADAFEQYEPSADGARSAAFNCCAAYCAGQPDMGL
jgi:hypothetical protein